MGQEGFEGLGQPRRVPVLRNDGNLKVASENQNQGSMIVTDGDLNGTIRKGTICVNALPAFPTGGPSVAASPQLVTWRTSWKHELPGA